jgi:anti-anti-sigma regulatory factor
MARKTSRAKGNDRAASITKKNDATQSATRAEADGAAVAQHHEQRFVSEVQHCHAGANGQPASTGGVDGELIVQLEATLGITAARHLYQKLAAVREQKRDVVFDASRIEVVDTAVLQLLMAFVQAMRADGFAVRWKSPSGPLHRTAALLDLEEHLGLGSADSDGPPERTRAR